MTHADNQVEKKKITVREYADMTGIGVTTVYRYIKQGKLETEKVDGVSYVVFNENQVEMRVDDSETKRLQDENQWLREQVTSLTRQVEDASKRHDTIVMQLTQQLDRSQLQLEDMRKKRTVWQRIKAVLATDTG